MVVRGRNNISLVKDDSGSMVTDSADQPRYQIALVMKTLTNPFFVNMEKGCKTG